MTANIMTLEANRKIQGAWAEWLTTFEFNLFATYTYKPLEDLIVGPKKGFRDLKKFLRLFKPNKPEFFAVAEKHVVKEDIHLHCLIKTDHEMRNIKNLWPHGFAKVLPLNDRGTAYCAKYLTKVNDVPIDFDMGNRDKRWLAWHEAPM